MSKTIYVITKKIENKELAIELLTIFNNSHEQAVAFTNNVPHLFTLTTSNSEKYIINKSIDYGFSFFFIESGSEIEAWMNSLPNDDLEEVIYNITTYKDIFRTYINPQ